MNTTLTLDKAGRIVLPKPVRDELQLSPGDTLEIESSEERIVLRPARGRGQMKKESGVWVFDSGEALSEQTVQKTLRRVRSGRSRKTLGRFD
jgi:AbrB family looped-hinge helix DNA binding protein